VTAAALAGWVLAAGLFAMLLRLRARLELVARAEHELRGPLTAFGLVLEGARRGRPVGGALDAELERARVALADLAAARRGRRAADVPRKLPLEPLIRSSAAAWGAVPTWLAGRAVVTADPGRVAQAVGNLLANAAEHGSGPPSVVTRREARAVKVEVSNPVRAPSGSGSAPGRGRGLGIAGSAARSAGGRVVAGADRERFVASLELPVEP
jgi:signal transduction histidine kinase